MFTAYILLFSYSLMVFLAVFSKKTVFSLFAFLSLSVPSFLLYYSYNAPDVALTEASIGAFLSFIFFYKTYSHTKEHHFNQVTSTKLNIIKVAIPLILCVGIFCLMFYACTLIEIISNEGEYSQYYNISYKETGIENTVTAILASYRAFDTLGETMIILISSIGIGQISKAYKSFR